MESLVINRIRRHLLLLDIISHAKPCKLEEIYISRLINYKTFIVVGYISLWKVV